MRLYIAGAITNDPNYKDKFAKACDEVMSLGHTPVSPVTLDHDGHGDAWSEYMIVDLHAMLDCEGVYALIDWPESKGAVIEVELARQLHKEVYYQRYYYHQQLLNAERLTKHPDSLIDRKV